MSSIQTYRPIALFLLALMPTVPLVGQDSKVQDYVATLKQSLQQSQEELRSYEWIETTSVKIKGDEKSNQQKRCYYGAEGSVQKVPITETSSKKKRGIRGRVVERKKGEITQEAQRAIELVRLYIPPDAARVQKVHDSGGSSLHVVKPEQQVRIELKNYRQEGDLLSIELGLSPPRLISLTVETDLGSPQDRVNLEASFGALQDGTSYASRIRLDVASKNLGIEVENSGYRKP